MSKAINYWTWKDSEIIAELDRLKISFPEPFNRKASIEALKLAPVTTDIKKTEAYIEQLKKENPKLETRKVIFHSAGEQDMPYVFVGHNGRAYYIPKEIEVDIPTYILNSCIKDAVEDRLLPRTDDRGNIVWVIRKVQRYPYSFVD